VNGVRNKRQLRLGKQGLIALGFAQWELVEMILASPRAAKLPKFSKERNILNFLEHEKVVETARLLFTAEEKEENTA